MDDVEVMCMQCGGYVEVMWIHIVKFPHVHIYTLDESLWYPVSSTIYNRPTQSISKPRRDNSK